MPSAVPPGGSPVVFVAHDTVHGALLDALSGALQARGYDLRRGAAADAVGLAPDTEIVVTTIRGRVDAATMAALKRLHTIVVPTTGLESIELHAATSLGIAVANGSTVENVVSIAEATAMLVLALLYRLPAVASGWRDQGTAAPAIMLSGKTVGLIGYGGVAQALVPRLQAFDARVLIRSSRDGLQAPGAAFVSLQELLERSDVVCVLAALNARTRHMIGRDELARMKPGAFIVNTARGGLIDEAALADMLAAGRLAGAALDTFEQEPLAPTSPLRTLRNVILTPHCIAHTRELAASFLPALMENIETACAGELPPYCKNPEMRQHWRRHAPASGRGV
jgi:phosphoglycerate dehydrogenase-like enzyme